MTVAALPSLAATLLPGAVARLRAEHPGVVVTIRDALAERILALVRSNEVDVALTSAPPTDPQLRFAPLLGDRMMAVMPRDHPLAHAKVVKLVDVLGAPLVLMDRDSSVRRSVDAACASSGLLAEPAYEVAFMSTAIGLVRAGLGATLLPSSAAELRATDDLAVRELAVPRIERSLGIVSARRRTPSPAVQAFVAILRSVAPDASVASRAAAASAVTAPRRRLQRR